MSAGDQLVVCFNGSCPVCRAEIDHYRRRAAQVPDLIFVDVAADPQRAARLGVTGEQGFRRLHVVDGAGRVVSGIAAFQAVWRRVPGYRWLAGLVALPLVRGSADLLYDRLAAPLLYRLHLRRHRRRSGGG